MKVCTDACVFGAYVSRQIGAAAQVAGSILDIGTGTGLLALMIAQNTGAKIDAIEIDEAAFKQAKDNFEISPWKARLTIFNADVLQFNIEKKYDWIVSNPPFFEGDLKSANKAINLARHESRLTLEQLLSAIKAHLSPQGSFAVLLPPHRATYFINLANAAGYLPAGQLLLRHTAAHPVFRHMLLFSSSKQSRACETIIIRDAQGNYTPGFEDLMKDYYLW